MKNTQISFDERLLDAIDRVAAASHKTRSAVIREAVKAWLNQKQIQEFEDRWIAKLKERPQDVKDSQAWDSAAHWEGG